MLLFCYGRKEICCVLYFKSFLVIYLSRLWMLHWSWGGAPRERFYGGLNLKKKIRRVVMKKLLESKILLPTTFFKDIPLVFWKFKLMYKLYFLNARWLKLLICFPFLALFKLKNRNIFLVAKLWSGDPSWKGL